MSSIRNLYMYTLIVLLTRILLHTPHLNHFDIYHLEKFPSSWWVDLSSNQISTLFEETVPMALGSLNISNNPDIDTKFMSKCFIMRLNAPVSRQKIGRYLHLLITMPTYPYTYSYLHLLKPTPTTTTTPTPIPTHPHLYLPIPTGSMVWVLNDDYCPDSVDYEYEEVE